MNKTLVYLYDPLCGWCYGAGGPLPQVLESTGLVLRLIPTGLFSGSGARAMDDDFAAYAWSNDQRIERLTGQTFTERYRDQVLADRVQAFDSGPSTLALSAVNLTSPEHEFEALKAIQAARYVDGLDVTRLETLTAVLANLGLNAAAERLTRPDSALLQANDDRVGQGRALLGRVGGRGVPTFVLQQADDAMQLLPASAIFSDPQAFIRELKVGVKP
ncbi:protein-disulfide isomerase [Pseudomonas sp. 250J]|uniref:DsbA family protein n=1 Tax=Pseudomonas peradeniyensis TaxID=2745488 RepID=A0ABT2V545_9PSED|nr:MULTISPECIES: DsbA family protein [Pseudomonas]KNX77260.1 protein-disulfide isomerase [Pseudomonas sp. 250J]MCU7236807.1 DsbA family protein [Pseudomonas peradeniyensis]MCU7281751.1 DsbA family protein [Pseudomonas peradeniyensis]QZA52514.1 DsbA family protein [Pseudomonas sp. 2hn]